MKAFKKISALILAAMISCAVSVTAFAVPEETAVSDENSLTAVAETTDIEENSSESSTESSATANGYSFDKNTIGNADLIASQEVLADDGYYQFIAVKTRSGDVFYVIIDRMKAENNVYFLNEVDTLDLLSLTGSDDNSDPAAVNTGKSTKSPELTSDGEVAVNDDETETSSADTKKSKSSFNMNFMLIGGIVAVGIIVFIIFMLKKGGLKKKKAEIPLDDDFDDDEEINEDKE